MVALRISTWSRFGAQVGACYSSQQEEYKAVGFVRNISRAWKYNRAKHVPPDIFVDMWEVRRGQALDHDSKAWLLANPIVVDLLHQMATGQLISGDEETDTLVLTAFLDRMVFSAAQATKEVLSGEGALLNVLYRFAKTYPDAGELVTRCFVAANYLQPPDQLDE